MRQQGGAGALPRIWPWVFGLGIRPARPTHQLRAPGGAGDHAGHRHARVRIERSTGRLRPGRLQGPAANPFLWSAVQSSDLGRNCTPCGGICSWAWARHRAGQVARPAHQLRAPGGAGDHPGHRHARVRLVDGPDQLQHQSGAGAANPFLWSAVQSSGLGRNCTPGGERSTANTRAAPTTRPRNCRWICSWAWARHRAGQVARPAHQLRAPAGAGDHAGHRHAHVRIERSAGRLRLGDGQDQLQHQGGAGAANLFLWSGFQTIVPIRNLFSYAPEIHNAKCVFTNGYSISVKL